MLVCSQKELLEFIGKHALPEAYVDLMMQYWKPLSECLAGRQERPLTVGINGAQGSGKTTLAACLKLLLEVEHLLRTEIISLDDFYRSKAQRIDLSTKVHPLLLTRGVPGTHEVSSMLKLFEEVKTGEVGVIRWPRFDKSTDDRHQYPHSAHLPIDILLFEGWCVGARPQTPDQLKDPINELEEVHDQDGRWRHCVNDYLGSDYQELFKQLDLLVMLQVPSWQSVRSWRLLQEQKLRSQTSMGMSDQEVIQFIEYFERLTKHQLDDLPDRSDYLIELDEEHQVRGIRGL